MSAEREPQWVGPRRRRVAIFGGAFNPPHLAHTITVMYLLGRKDVDEVWVLPTFQHVFGKPMAPFDARVEMLELAFAQLDQRRITVSRFEAERSLPNRTYDTLRLLRHCHPDCEFLLALGSDNLTESHRWHRFDDLVAETPVIVLGRPGHESSMRRFADEPWFRLGPTLPAISSTELRAALAGQRDRAMLTWVPEACLELCIEHYGLPPPSRAIGSVVILGAGRCGGAMGVALAAAGVEVLDVWNRSGERDATSVGALPSSLGEARIWILAVADTAIAPLAERLRPLARQGVVALHCAGRLGSEVLAPLAEVGVSTGSLHPMQSLQGSASGSGAMRGVYCAVEGDDTAREVATALVEAMGALPVELALGRKPAWHAAAVLACSGVTSAVAAGIELLTRCGIGRDEAQRVLLPLVRGTVLNLGGATVSEALTGPFARGDLDAVAAHVAAIRDVAPDLGPAYRELARIAARIGGWDEAARAALDGVLTA